MQASSRKRIQVLLLALFLVAAARLALIWNERRQANAPPPAARQGSIPADYYVVPKKTHAYDIPSLRAAVVGRPVWVREGYRWTYFPYHAETRRSDFRHPVGQLPPLERLEIRDIVTGVAPEAPGQKQVLAVFRQNGKDYAFSVGAEKGGDMRIYIDEMIYIEDPRQLYGYWGTDTWDAIARHQVKPGMNQLQASFAVGFGQPGPGGMNDRTVVYPNGGNSLQVTYRDDRAVGIQPARD